MNEVPASLTEGTINPDTGRPPERRFQNPKDKYDGTWLYNQVEKFRMVGDLKDQERREVEAMLRHAPPYSPEDLTALNMEHMPNSTMGELPRRVADEEGKWTDYVVSASGLWQITFPEIPGELHDTLQERFSDLINTLWMDDPRHVMSLQLAFRQFSCYGIGPLLWTDCYDPTPIARTTSNLTFTPGTRLTLDNFSECALKDSCTPQDLYATIRGEVGKMRAKLYGWKRGEVMKILKFNATGDHTNSHWGGSLESIELMERNGENIWHNYKGRDIKLIHVYIREYEPDKDGKVISHVVLGFDGTHWRVIRDKGFEYSSPWQFLVLATDRVGSDMTISGLRGMGVDLLEHCRSMDVMHNASMYAGFRSSIPVYATNGGSGANSADQISVRPNGVVIPTGFTEVQTQVNFQAGGWMIDRLSNLADRYQRIYDINAPNKGGVQRTKGEAVLDAAKESDSRQNQVLPIVRLFFEPLGREFVRRLFLFPKNKDGTEVLKFKGWELAQKFWTKVNRIIQEYGIPLIVLKEHRVTINPANTPGGLDKKLMRTQAMMGFYPYLQTQEQRNWIVNNGMIAIAGYQSAKPFLNKNEPKNPLPLDVEIDSENATMASGQQRRVFPEQDHLRHLGPVAPQGPGHIPFIMGKLAEISQGIFDKFSLDHLDALSHQLRALVTMKGHLDAHLAMLAQNPVIMDMPEVQAYFDFTAQLEQILLQTIKHFEKQMQERNPNGQMDPKTKALLEKTRAEIQVMQMKTQAEIAMMNQKHMVKLGNQTQTAEARREQKNAQFILDSIVKKKEAEADIAIKGMENILDLEAERRKMEEKSTAQNE